MIKNLAIFFTFLIFFLLNYEPALAITDPASVPNNKFGIHIFSEKDLVDAAKLVNTNGDWGYVTVVITEAERDRNRWQNVFDQMRHLHLIPVIRIATKARGNIWEKPKNIEIDNWVKFFNSLNWVVKNRYVVIGNEPNLDNEWGGESDPKAYTLYLKDFSEKLRSASNDFFVLPAGLAPEPNEFKFIKSMLKFQPNIFDYVDGWTSHSYPSTSTRLYKDETKFINKNLPVFITETGWSNKNYSEEEINKKLVDAYQNIWNDSRVIAVTPFILNYPQSPFGVFSWTRPDGSFYSFYDTVQNLPKIKGEPEQITKGDILFALAQPIILSGSNYVGTILAKNTGQSIWNPTNISINNVLNYSFNEIGPMQLGLIIFKAVSPKGVGIYNRSLFLTDKKGNQITNSFPIESLMIKY